MRVVEVADLTALCDARGIRRDVSLFLLQHEQLVPGDYVIVHVGYAIQKINGQEAQSAWELLDTMLAAEDAIRVDA